MIKLRCFWKGVILILLGIFIGYSLNNPISIEKGLEFAYGQKTEDLASPSNWVNENQIKVYRDHVRIDIDNPEWATFTPTRSMDPVFDEGAYAIQIRPEKDQLSEGDIITYRNIDNLPIIHRIIEIGDDGEWYAYAKGDNNPRRDPDKIRWDQVEKVLVAIIY